jgi:flagellar motor switch protein FliM
VNPAPSLPRAHPAGTSARENRASTAKAVPYDFRRPIQLSREHSRILQVGFDGFARQATTVFTSALRTVCTVSLVSVEQCNYSEYVDSLLAPTYMTIFTADPMPGRGVLEMPIQAVMSCIDHILGGPGSPDQPVRNLSEIESSVVQGFTERLLSEMRYSLSNVLEFEPAIVGVEYSPLFAQLAAGSDVVAVATFELQINELQTRVTVCLPFAGLLPHLVAAAAPAPVSEREQAKRALSADLLKAQFETVPVDVTIRFRTTRVSPDSLGDLAVGDVVRLSHPAAAPLEVATDDTTFAHATPGAKGPRLAALIVGAPKETR